MGLGRDIGAALTFGLSVTTKHKEAETNWTARTEMHTRHINSYNAFCERFHSNLDTMYAHLTAAQKVLLSTGALSVDINDNVSAGWYIPREEDEIIENNPDYTRSTFAAIPAFGLGIGTPAAIWTLVGIYGTAATGTAIGSLSGAAAGAATAAWIGRAATLGLGGGMTAGRIALGPIGVAASLLTLPIGAALAGSNERNYILRTEKAGLQLTHCEGILARSRNQMSPLLHETAKTIADLARHTSQLETANPDTPEAKEIIDKLDLDMRKATNLLNTATQIIEERNAALASSNCFQSDQE